MENNAIFREFFALLLWMDVDYVDAKEEDVDSWH